ncbi:transcription factor IIA, alpha/beta subunit [Marasmius fiardii PR-910]|nr:transcription factor IIA, alpha/beta subunit [Marasmius fiardii PR-910]
MSNKIVPAIYQAVIEDVMNGIKPEFEEYGVGDDVFTQLREKWQAKLLDSRVADFEAVQQQPPPSQHHPYPAHPILMPGTHPHYYTSPPGAGQIKTEPADPRYALNAPQLQYSVPPLPGPQLNGAVRPQQFGGQAGVLSFAAVPPPTIANNGPAGVGIPLGRQYVPNVAPSSSSQTSTSTPAPSTNGINGARIPQVDGTSDDSDDSPSPPSFAPRPSHPSLPQPQSQTASSSGAGDEAINSDLDDSDEGDDEGIEEGTVQDADIVFCTYDKVARVKNKWKCILKDGMIHVNNKDYLFSKCTGEFEW